MREIVKATGDTGTKYNIFSQLEAWGHGVRREGGRIFLKHKDAVSTKDDAHDPEESPSEPMVPEVEQWPLSPEGKLQLAVRGSLDKLEPGLVAIDRGATVRSQRRHRYADSRYEAESAHHPARCSYSFSWLEGLSPTYSGRGAMVTPILSGRYARI
jgi:hypothetical protein